MHSPHHVEEAGKGSTVNATLSPTHGVEVVRLARGCNSRRSTSRCFDVAMSCDADLDQVVEVGVRADVRSASLYALRGQLQRARSVADQQALRMLLLRAARIARSRGIAVADDLVGLAKKDASWLVTPGALEACGPLRGPIQLRVRDGPPVDAVVQAQLEALKLPVGPDLETKYRFTALNSGPDGLHATFAPTTWTSGHGFHVALQQDLAFASKLPDGRWSKPIPFGDQLLPGIAVAHAIILTADRHVIAAKRSRTTSYAPLHWSISFEEQLNENDFGCDQDAFTAAARRGFHEEFGAEVPAADVIPLASVMQVDLLNLGIVMLVCPAMTAREIRDSWHSAAVDGWEAEDVLHLPLDDLLATSLGMQLHPSSELRCLALRRWLSSR